MGLLTVRSIRFVVFFVILAAGSGSEVRAQRQLESLDRGVVAIHEGDGQVSVSWRLLGTDAEDVAFNLYRTFSDTTVRLNETPLTTATHYVDSGADLSRETAYFVRSVVEGEEQAASAAFALPADPPVRPYLSIPLQTDLPEGARLVATGDLDGDGAFDFVVKRGRTDIDPSQDTSWSEADTYKLEAYRSDGTFLWRFDLGVNIRPGIWYSPFLVYDLDGDGSAEVATKIGEREEDWNGDQTTDYREPSGRILSGPEYLVLLDGETGEIVARTDWIERGQIRDWGDAYGNRANRNMLAVAYLDGQRPSLIVTRGLYGGQSGFASKMVAQAWDFRDGALTRRWTWSRSPGGAGFQNYRVGDIDADGKDEFIHGSLAIDDDGTTLWDTEEGHGDRMHMTDVDPGRPGLEIWYVQEDPSDYEHAVHLRDATTGTLLWGNGDGSWGDVGRGMAADIDPRHSGVEVWASRGSLYSAEGTVIGDRPSSVNLGVWWDGDRLRELLDGRGIEKWNWENGTSDRLLTADGDTGSRNAPMGYGDVIGDWREEVWYTVGNEELRIYTTTMPTPHRFQTLLHDTDYRTSLAAETSGYMQSTQPGFFLGADLKATALDGPSALPEGFVLESVFPNPSRSPVSVVAMLPQAGLYQVRVVNVLGQVVHEQHHQVAAPGRTEWVLDLTSQPGGTYLISVHHPATQRTVTTPVTLWRSGRR